jgi:hypothetical protein
MKILTIIHLIFIFVNLGFAQEQSDSSRALEGVVIKETFKVKIDEEKLPLNLDVDFSNVVQLSESINWQSINSLKNEKNGDDWKLFNMNLSTSELTNIQPQPAKVFYLQFKGLSSWELEIYSSDGSLFKSILGKNNPPESIAWNGIGDNEEALIPGHNYSYAFQAVDKAGNKRTFPGQTFNIPALCIKYDNKVLVGIDFSEVYSSEGFVLLKNATNYATELSSLIRYYSSKGSVIIDFDHPLKNEFLTLVSNNLNKDVSFFKETIETKNKQNAIIVWIE